MMGAILVIADDLTGAAELGGIAIRYGLQAKISHQIQDVDSNGVQIINTNTRSLRSEDILKTLKTFFEGNFDVHTWKWVFLKFDSAMRGEIAIQLEFFKEIFGASQLIFCPVNPYLGRVIRDGQYYIGEQEISKSDFANDPEFPIQNSAVRQMLTPLSVFLLNKASEISGEMRYIVPAIATDQALDDWANQLGNFKLFAGAGPFFERLLFSREKTNKINDPQKSVFARPLLYVCGSKYEESLRRISKVPKDQLLCWLKPGEEQDQAIKLTEILNHCGVAVFCAQPQDDFPAAVIRNSMGNTVRFLQEQCRVQELVIEGGATAHAVLEALHIDTLRPYQELSPGVIRSRSDQMAQMVTVKPGSYPWADELWAF